MGGKRLVDNYEGCLDKNNELRKLGKDNCELCSNERCIYNHNHKHYKRKLYRQRHADKQKKYYAKWYKEKGRRRAENYKEIIYEWTRLFPEKVKIRDQLDYVIKIGIITRPKICPKCGREARIQAHHFNYEHFMNFIWLCASCHKKVHNSMKDAWDKKKT